MLPPKKTPPDQRELQRVFARLSVADRQSVLAFAQFLAQRDEAQVPATGEEVSRQPISIERPEEESVVAAIRRLAQTYPMLNKDELLHESSSLMTGHVMQGHAAPEVIDKLEALFAQAYERYAADNANQEAD